MGTISNQRVNSIADLRLLKGISIGQGIATKSYRSGNDNGGNSFYCIATSSGGYTDNGGSIIIGDDGRVYEAINKGFVYIEEFGAVLDNVTDDFTAWSNAANTTELIKVKTPWAKSILKTSGNIKVTKLHGNNIQLTLESVVRFNKTGAVDIDLKDIKLITVGNKYDTSVSTSSGRLYADSATVHNSISIVNFEHIALTVLADLSSWSDDTNKARYRGILESIANSHRYENIRTYGVASPIVVRPVDNTSKHYARNIVGYNVETLYYVASGINWHSCNLSELHLINTDIQQTYWIGQDDSTGLNGKDTILYEPSNLNISYITNISAEYAIERSLYNQAANCVISNTIDTYGNTGMAMCKYGTELSGARRLNNQMHDIKAITEATSASLQVYGQENLTIKNFHIINKLYETGAVKPQEMTLGYSTKNIRIADGYSDNIITFMAYTVDKALDTVPNGLVTSLVIENVKLRNLSGGGARFANIMGMLYTIGNHPDAIYKDILVRNVHCSNDAWVTKAMIARHCFEIWNAENFKIENVTGFFSTIPFQVINSTGVDVINSEFKILITQTAAYIMNLLNNPELQANNFDFTIKQVAGLVNGSMVMKFKREISESVSDLVKCYDYWSEWTYEKKIPANTYIQWDFPVPNSFKLLATYENSGIENLHAAGGRSFIGLVGSDFSDTSNSITFQITALATGFRVKRTSTTLAGGILRLKCVRI